MVQSLSDHAVALPDCVNEKDVQSRATGRPICSRSMSCDSRLGQVGVVQDLGDADDGGEHVEHAVEHAVERASRRVADVELHEDAFDLLAATAIHPQEAARCLLRAKRRLVGESGVVLERLGDGVVDAMLPQGAEPGRGLLLSLFLLSGK